MRAAGSPPTPDEPAWSAKRIAAALPPVLRAQFHREHLALLALWQARAQDRLQPDVDSDSAPEPASAPGKWGDLMDDWEL